MGVGEGSRQRVSRCRARSEGNVYCIRAGLPKPKHLLEIQILGLCDKSTESETPWAGPRGLCK